MVLHPANPTWGPMLLVDDMAVNACTLQMGCSLLDFCNPSQTADVLSR